MALSPRRSKCAKPILIMTAAALFATTTCSEVVALRGARLSVAAFGGSSSSSPPHRAAGNVVVRLSATTTMMTPSSARGGDDRRVVPLPWLRYHRAGPIRPRASRTPAFASEPQRSGLDQFASPRSSIMSVGMSSTTGDGSPRDTDAIEDDDSSSRARLVFLGTPDVAAASLLSLVRASQEPSSCFDVVGVVTQPPKRRKRRGKPEPSPVGEVAENFGIPVLCPEKAKSKEFLDELEESLRPDICITAAYGQWLPKRFLAAPRLGTLNIHPSLLPRWRGASPVQRSLEAGDPVIGVTVLFTVSKMDAGPIVAQKEYKVGSDEQASDVLPYLFGLGTTLLLDVLPDVVSGGITMDTARRQDEDLVVPADMIDASEGELKVWEDSATACHNKVRAFSTWPGTYMFLRIGDSEEPSRIKVIRTRVVDTAEDTPFYAVRVTRTVELGKGKKAGLRVVCGDGSVLELLQVQPVAKKVMDAKSFVNGLRGQSIEWTESAGSPVAS